MRNGYIVLNHRGVRELLNSRGVEEDLARRGEKVKNSMASHVASHLTGGGESRGVTVKTFKARSRAVCLIHSWHRNHLKAAYREAGG
jgi:hypothetical protein